eukprot:881201-Rhodomonas_salina.3
MCEKTTTSSHSDRLLVSVQAPCTAHMSPGKGRRFGMSSCKSPCDFSVAGLSMSRYPMDDTGSAGDGQLGNAVGSTTACQCDSR